MWRTTKFWIIIFSALFILGVGAFLLLQSSSASTHTARITLDGELYDEIDLDAVALPYDITIETEEGYNIIHVEHGQISVSEADCPDQICVRQGAISDSIIPIACLPHRLVIEIVGAE